ncbi:hypothetical protein WA026_004765 [Henosepilachna vigintioctopunctata]|uniref:Uncharacterized protein n=1 Tax=Henosepilachna vigintioctopunctata TaxID=420089 RepID=A0AAW1V7G6_9CUCU
MNIAKEVIGYKTREHKQSWMTDEILSLMDERRKFKTQRNQENYRKIPKQIRTKIRIANNECFNLHKKLKEVAGIYRKRNFATITNENNEIESHEKQFGKIISETYSRMKELLTA